MNFYIKQKVFSWNDKFFVYNDYGMEAFYAVGKMFSFGKKLYLYDASGAEAAYVQQKLFSFLPKFHVYRGENMVAEVKKNFTFFRQEYTVGGLGWKVYGNFLAHDYTVADARGAVATVHKDWFTFGDCYKITVRDDADVVNALAVVLVIDSCIDMADGTT